MTYKINPVFRYKTARFLHWAVAALILALYASGLIMNHIIGHKAINIIQIHVQLGLLLCCFVCLAIAWKYSTTFNYVIGRLKNVNSLRSECLYLLIYCLVLSILSLGIVFVEAKGRHLAFLGLVDVPTIISTKPKPVTKFIFQWHKWLSHTLIVCASLHIINILIRKKFWRKK